MTKSRRVDDDSTVGIFVIIWVEGCAGARASNPEKADLCYRLSDEELNHMMALKKDVVCIIPDYRREKVEAPESMMTLYRYTR